MAFKVLISSLQFMLIVAQVADAQRGYEKPGSCPQTLTGGAINRPNCPISCRADSDCKADFKCCSSFCGGKECAPPTITRPPQVKPGQCPQSFSKGGDVTNANCTRNQCRKDSDCRGTLKCCSNICGGLICTLPSRPGYSK